MKPIITFFMILLFSVSAWAASPALKNDYPQRYVVVKGDTLWDISGKFLQNPWQWPKLWKSNKHIKNPHLIYPGDVLRLVFINGQPVLEVNGQTGYVEQQPQPRQSGSIPFIPLAMVESFLTTHRVVRAASMDRAPHVVGVEQKRLIAGAGDKIYVRGQFTGDQMYSVYRKSNVLIDPDTARALGIEALHVADVRVLRYDNDIAEMAVIRSNSEIQKNDFVLPSRDEIDWTSYSPSMPDRYVEGRVIALNDSASQVGRWDVITLNRGFNHGLRPGNVLHLHKAKRRALDEKYDEIVMLPSQIIGDIVVFRVFEELSYALVMRVEDVVKKGDYITSPK